MHSFSLRELLHDGSLDDAGGALTLLSQERGRDGEADTRPHLDELLPAQPARPGDLHALRERLAISNDSASRAAGVAGFGGLADPDADDVAERSWMWMIGEAA